MNKYNTNNNNNNNSNFIIKFNLVYFYDSEDMKFIQKKIVNIIDFKINVKIWN